MHPYSDLHALAVQTDRGSEASLKLRVRLYRRSELDIPPNDSHPPSPPPFPFPAPDSLMALILRGFFMTLIHRGFINVQEFLLYPCMSDSTGTLV